MKLYVGNLSKQVNDAKLSELAAPFGTMLSAKVAVEKGTGASKGFGFIEYSTTEEGNAAIKGLDGKEVDGQALKVNEARPRKDAPAR